MGHSVRARFLRNWSECELDGNVKASNQNNNTKSYQLYGVCGEEERYALIRDDDG